MIRYPLPDLEEISVHLQKIIAEYRHQERFDFSISFEERGQRMFDSSRNIMNKVGIEVLPKLKKVLVK